MSSRLEGRKELPPSVAEKVREAMRDLLETRYDNNRRALGKALGITGQAVGKHVRGDSQPGRDVARQVAKLTGDPQLMRVLADEAGMAWGTMPTFASGRKLENLEAVLIVHKNKKRWTEAVIAAARAIPWSRDYEPEEWPTLLDRLAALVEFDGQN